MRRELKSCIAVVALASAAGCVQSAEKRAERAATREREQSPVRASPTVQRVTIPRDSGRILYDAPTDLSDTTTRTASPSSSP